MTAFSVNGKDIDTDLDQSTSLVWFLREELGLTGTKWGCGEGLCGSCTVLINGRAERACQVTLGDAASANIITIEGIEDDHPVKQAWLREAVPECGYCQPGQIMNAISLLRSNPKPSETEVIRAMDSNLCRCGTYNRIKAAILRASKMK